MRNIQREHQSAFQFFDRLHVAGPDLELMTWNHLRRCWIKALSSNSQELQDFEDSIEEDVVELNAVAETLLALEDDRDLNIRLVDDILSDQRRRCLWEALRQEQDNSVECSSVSEELFVLRHVLVSELH